MRLALGVLAAVLAVLAGCGGDDEPSAEGWASDVCGRVDEWLGDVQDIVTEGGDDDPLALLEENLERVVDETDELVDDLRDIPPPDVESGEEAEEEVEALAEQLEERVDRVREQTQDVVEVLDLTEALEVLAGVTKELEGGREDLEESLDRVRELDADGELGDAVENADACEELRERSGG